MGPRDPLLRLGVSTAVKQRRLAELRSTRPVDEAALDRALAVAHVKGSLELAGQVVTEVDLAPLRAGRTTETPAGRLFAALGAVDADAAFGVASLRRWHATATNGTGELRHVELERPDRPPPAPAARIELRLTTLSQWLFEDAGGELTPSQLGALAFARLMEILPFEQHNGIVARLAVSHLMRQRGARSPLLDGGDRERLDEALLAAFRLETEALCRLLEEASERALDVMIEALERG